MMSKRFGKLTRLAVERAAQTVRASPESPLEKWEFTKLQLSVISADATLLTGLDAALCGIATLDNNETVAVYSMCRLVEIYRQRDGETATTARFRAESLQARMSHTLHAPLVVDLAAEK